MEKCRAFWASFRPWQFPDLDCSTRFEMRIARQQRRCVIEIIGVDADVADEMCAQRRPLPGLSHAEAIADRAAALESTAAFSFAR